ncbi:unnamed protein product [Phytophthora fragariaefolia]|uniref:Unnamed protein product n=1 Tax=Phytophthora fragariaefolia TaxID=1490495 RepID=A0A9W6Y049_9STRA|nr:unnamed protein product [Phytophthora fragariaefolia]
MAHDHRSRIQNDGSDIRILDAGDVCLVQSAGREGIRRFTASLCVEAALSSTTCPMEEFYNQIRQWLNPAKHAGMLPAMPVAVLHIRSTSTLVQHALMDTFGWATCSVATIHSKKQYYWQKAIDICQLGSCIRTEILPTTR